MQHNYLEDDTLRCQVTLSLSAEQEGDWVGAFVLLYVHNLRRLFNIFAVQHKPTILLRANLIDYASRFVWRYEFLIRKNLPDFDRYGDLFAVAYDSFDQHVQQLVLGRDDDLLARVVHAAAARAITLDIDEARRHIVKLQGQLAGHQRRYANRYLRGQKLHVRSSLHIAAPAGEADPAPAPVAGPDDASGPPQDPLPPPAGPAPPAPPPEEPAPPSEARGGGDGPPPQPVAGPDDASGPAGDPLPPGGPALPVAPPPGRPAPPAGGRGKNQDPPPAGPMTPGGEGAPTPGGVTFRPYVVDGKLRLLSLGDKPHQFLVGREYLACHLSREEDRDWLMANVQRAKQGVMLKVVKEHIAGDDAIILTR